MRKAFLFCVVLVMVMGISFSATAAPGGFISSPSGNKAPVILEFTMDGEDCSAQLKITPFSQRETLPEVDGEALEDAYDDIVGAPDITVLEPDLKNIADDLGIPGKNLAVSDLFDISLDDCTHTENGHSNFSIKMSAETLENFVGLMYKHDGEWKVVSGAKVTGEDKDTLTFISDEISPFAIVVNSNGTHIDVPQPPTGDINLVPYIVLMAVSAVALILVGMRLKKESD
ncbi:MAG: hypothetical protein E7384_02025 [Ruminococcaceae bacterium]|nr:hypothetical protein [Oscillospiraceae bacterium]